MYPIEPTDDRFALLEQAAGGIGGLVLEPGLGLSPLTSLLR